MKIYDVVIIGAGAAGLKAAAELRNRNKSFLIIDMGNTVARKVAISGGGKCNFTNIAANYTQYFGKNPQFARSALSQWSPNDTLNWVKAHNIEVYEKEPGRFFCKNSANDIIKALLYDIRDTEIKKDSNVINVDKNKEIFEIKTSAETFKSKTVIIATGGITYPHLGVSNTGHIIAKKFGHKIEPLRPGLCGIKTKFFSPNLSGISLPVQITVNNKKITGDLLFTHFGIGGPVVYRASLFGEKNIIINFAPEIDIFEFLKTKKQTNGKKSIANILSEIFPNKLARFLYDDNRNTADISDKELKEIANKINCFKITDACAIGTQSAEVTVGGVSVDKISSKTMESLICPGLFFAGEVLDITGDLGGFNIQWAFSSGFVAGLNA